MDFLFHLLRFQEPTPFLRLKRKYNIRFPVFKADYYDEHFPFELKRNRLTIGLNQWLNV